LLFLRVIAFISTSAGKRIEKINSGKPTKEKDNL
jgi:hypothetical protein